VTPIDLLPALVLPALVLIGLVVSLPFAGARAAERKRSWARFEAICRARGVDPQARAALHAWATELLPDEPELVVTRRREFDRFARAEVARLAGRADRGPALVALSTLRERLGHRGAPGPAQSSHDLRPGERLELRHDDGARVDARVLAVDEEGIRYEVLAGRGPRGDQGKSPAWAAFGRDGDATYRFRAQPVALPGGPLAIAHGDFLVREERRTEPRVPLVEPPFWIAVERLPDGQAPEDPEGVEVEALDVSTGGMALLADRDVRRGSEVGLDLPLGPGRVVTDLRARVVGRGYREGGGPRAHFLRCEFVSLDPVQRRALEAFVSTSA
jgi:hypothetical protein